MDREQLIKEAAETAREGLAQICYCTSLTQAISYAEKYLRLSAYKEPVQFSLPKEEIVDEDERQPNVVYTYYHVDIEDMGEEWDYTICESLDHVRRVLEAVDIHLDDDTRKASVTIKGVPMTPTEYNAWKKENIDE